MGSLVQDPRRDSSVTGARKRAPIATASTAESSMRLRVSAGWASRVSRARPARPPPVTLRRMRRSRATEPSATARTRACRGDAGFGVDVDPLEFGEEHHRVDHLVVFDREHRAAGLAQRLAHAPGDRVRWRLVGQHWAPICAIWAFASATERSISTLAPNAPGVEERGERDVLGQHQLWDVAGRNGRPRPGDVRPRAPRARRQRCRRPENSSPGMVPMASVAASITIAEPVAPGDVAHPALEDELVLGREPAWKTRSRPRIRPLRSRRS